MCGKKGIKQIDKAKQEKMFNGHCKLTKIGVCIITISHEEDSVFIMTEDA